MKAATSAVTCRPSLSLLCALLIVALAFLFYLHFVLTFGVNVPIWDDWELLDQIRKIQLGEMDWWKLLASRHAEHLMSTAFFLETLQLMLSDFNYKLQLVTSAIIQALTFGIFTSALWRSIPTNRRPLWLAISSVIWFTLAQYQNSLWPFQTAWFLVSFFLAVALLCLNRASQLVDVPNSAWAVWSTLAAVAALLASFTSFQGTIVWLAGTAYLIGRQSYHLKQAFRTQLLRHWFISGAFSLILFTIVWRKLGGRLAIGGGKLSAWNLIYIFIGIHGNFWGNLGFLGLFFIGIVMLAFVGLALARVLFSKEKEPYALPVSLIAFGLGFVLFASLGRAKFGLWPASDSHYTAYSVMTYFGALCILLRRDETLPKLYPSRWGPLAYVAAIILATFTSSYSSILRGIEWRINEGMSAAALVNYHDQPDFAVTHLLFFDRDMVRRNAEFLAVHKFGPFGDPNAIPASVTNYLKMPSSLEGVITRHPQQQAAILRAWQVYQTSPDLRSSYNPLSDKFAEGFLGWCAETTATHGHHYLGKLLDPFTADYQVIKNAEFAPKDSPVK